jgi:hypothetical protein
MDAAALKQMQAPFKERYRAEPEAAVITLKAEGAIGEGVTCSVQTAKALVEAGLHPATGGSGLHACSGDMLLEALAACAGVTLPVQAFLQLGRALGHQPALQDRIGRGPARRSAQGRDGYESERGSAHGCTSSWLLLPR